jgi:hypothetical protein
MEISFLIWMRTRSQAAQRRDSRFNFDVWRGLNVRLAVSEGGTARLSGQMSMTRVLRD